MQKQVALALSFAGFAFAQEPAQPAGPTPGEAKKQSSLAMGYQEGARARLKQISPEDIDPEAFLDGFHKGLNGQPLDISPEDIRDAMKYLQQKIRTREKELASTNRLEEERFLQANLRAPNIVQTKSGLQYRIVERGQGLPLGEENLEKKELFVTYRGTLPNGQEFSVVNETSPVSLDTTGIIPGFREALGMMRQGAKWVIFIPSSLAYGVERHSDVIGPNQLLIFEITLVDIKSPESEKNSTSEEVLPE